jgi:hypothetical protein
MLTFSGISHTLPSSYAGAFSESNFIDALEVPTDFARTNKYEDFAESFVAFMAAPQKLSKNAMFRMQQALSISGLYGRPIVRLGGSRRTAVSYGGPYSWAIVVHGVHEIEKECGKLLKRFSEILKLDPSLWVKALGDSADSLWKLWSKRCVVRETTDLGSWLGYLGMGGTDIAWFCRGPGTPISYALGAKIGQNVPALIKEVVDSVTVYVASLRDIIRQAGDTHFTYAGFKIENPERLPDLTVKRLLDGIDFVVSIFNKRGVKALLHLGVSKFVLLPTVRWGHAAGMYHPSSRSVEVAASDLLDDR